MTLKTLANSNVQYRVPVIFQKGFDAIVERLSVKFSAHPIKVQVYSFSFGFLDLTSKFLHSL